MGEKIKNKYFGTDGYRGEANIGLTSQHAYKIGRFLGWYFSSPHSGCNTEGYRPKIAVGKDTRRSSYMLEYAIAAGVSASGGDVHMLHVITTPGVSYVTRTEGFDAGVMITASHNPYYDNGIKIISRSGEKLDDETTALVEHYIDGNMSRIGIDGDDLPLAVQDKIGRVIDYVSGRNRYVGYLISLASNSYKRLKIGLDCANGSSHMIAKAVFDALGAKTYVIGAQPNGLNINENCGSTHIEELCKLVVREKLDIGFAFDGDADRCLAVDSGGNIIDGDAIMYILARRAKSLGMLSGNTVVATVMSNRGFVRSLNNIGINISETCVGDRFVYEEMQRCDYALGGEQSGHIILKKYATTGDGILTALMICEEICDSKLPLSALVTDLTLYPQKLVTLYVKDKKAVMTDKVILNLRDSINEELSDQGRILLRESGTEPAVRIMVEAESDELCGSYSTLMTDIIKERGYLK